MSFVLDTFTSFLLIPLFITALSPILFWDLLVCTLFATGRCYTEDVMLLSTGDSLLYVETCALCDWSCYMITIVHSRTYTHAQAQ